MNRDFTVVPIFFASFLRKIIYAKLIILFMLSLPCGIENFRNQKKNTNLKSIPRATTIQISRSNTLYPAICMRHILHLRSTVLDIRQFLTFIYRVTYFWRWALLANDAMPMTRMHDRFYRHQTMRIENAMPSVTSWSGGKFNDRRDTLGKYRTSIDQAFMRRICTHKICLYVKCACFTAKANPWRVID